jgi:hypothetical protein
LRGADDIEDSVGPEILHTMLDRREIRCAVTISTVRLADDERHRLAFAAGELGEEHAQRAVGDRRDPLGFQLLADPRERVVVGRLTGQVGVGERHLERRVDPVEIALGQPDELTPEPQRLGVTSLQRDDPRPGPVGKRPLGIELRPGREIEGVGVGLDDQRLGRALTDLDQVLDEHAERRAPITDVVLPDHSVPEMLERAGERVPHHGRAQVPDVHLLGDVGRRVVDDDDPRRIARDAEHRVGPDGLHRRRDP